MRRNFHRVSISISLSIEAENSRVRADGDYANVRARRGIGKLSRVKIRGSLNPSRRSWNSNITGRLTYRRRFNDESRPLEIPSFCIDHFTGERAWKPKAAVPFFLSSFLSWISSWTPFASSRSAPRSIIWVYVIARKRRSTDDDQPRWITMDEF